MPLKSIRAWLGVDPAQTPEAAPLRETLEALDHLEPDRARYLAAFAYLLGRVAQADQYVSPEETAAMEGLVREQGQLSPDQAAVVVQLAKTSNLLFGGTANFMVAREFSALATYDQKLSLMRCLFAVSATDATISTAEEGEIHRIAGELRIDQPDLVALRVAHQQYLPGLSRETRFSSHELDRLVNYLKGRSPAVPTLVFFGGPAARTQAMTAEAVAHALTRRLVRVDLTQLISKYLGETEKNLDRVFEEAARSGAVLFFDEADALFGKRTDVESAGDRYGSLEVAYLLQRLEAHSGIVVMAVNNPEPARKELKRLRRAATAVVLEP
jgi:uncharacterized tellurite resistance protein B-like protein